MNTTPFLNRLHSAATRLLPALLIALALLSVIRLVFHAYNNEFLAAEAAKGWLRAYSWGIRYDLTVLFPVFLAAWAGLVIADGLPWKRLAQRIALAGLRIAVALILLVSVADIPYYRFNGRRATREVLDILGDSASAFGAFLPDFGWFVPFYMVLLLAFWYASTRAVHLHKRYRLWTVSGMVVLLLLSINFGRIPTPKNVTFFVPPSWAPVVANTPMTLGYSFLKKQQRLERKAYFSTEEELESVFSIDHHFSSNRAFEKRNVVIFLLESFSREYLVAGHSNKAYTPFLDSLMGRSIVFNNAFSNGTTSAYALMSILGGIPPFLDEPYFSSIYGSNRLTGIGTLLGQKGYSTHFFYGAEEDHYGFKKNTALLGIRHYHSRQDYPGRDYDGQWGVYDGPFFAYAADQMLADPQPVFATIFNISSHYPYAVPEAYREALPRGRLISHRSLSYVDLSLRQFFDRIEGTPLKDSTIFVFIADHWAKTLEMEDRSAVGIYRIPFFLHDPLHPEGRVVEAVADQVDVLPTILDYLHYSGPWMSFGTSALSDTGYRYTYNEFGNIYQIIDSSFALTYNERKEESISLYNYRSDPGLRSDLLQDMPERAAMMERHLKAVIQTYNNRLLDNELVTRDE